MKKIITIILFAVNAAGATSQVNLLRYNDNFNYLKVDSISKKGTEKLKYIPISGTTTISFGGEIREQLQFYKNINFGDVPMTFSTATTWQLWHRVMAHSNIEIGKKLRVFTQLSSTHRFINPNPLTAEIDQNDLSLHQLFAEYRVNKNWMIRMGRQELFYGNHRLLTFREGPNTRLAFDGAIIKVAAGKHKLDIMTLSPVIAKEGIFDDENFKDLIVGIYGTEKAKSKTIGFDYYFLNYYTKRRKYNFTSGKEDRQIVGLRFFSDKPAFKYEFEGTYQWGTFNNLRINAYSISVDVNHKVLASKSMVTGIAGGYVTGDRKNEDNQLNTYNLLFSKPQYGLTAPIGATNIITLIPYIKLNPVKKSNLYTGANFMWRQSNNDGSYSPGAIEMRPVPELLLASNKKRIGTLLIMEFNYFVNYHLSFSADASYFFAGNYVKETGKGKDITYLSFKASYKF